MRCAECKGRGFCGLPQCPIVSRFLAAAAIKRSDTYFGSAPSVFIGRQHYPEVKGGPLLINENASPPDWIRNNYTIGDIVGVRARTIRGTSPLHTIIDPVQEIALSSVPIDVEVRFDKPLHFDLIFDGILAPVGYRGSIRTIDVLDNAHPARSVSRITGDTDLRAAEAVSSLYSEGIDTYRITDLLTAGLLGVKRRIVPTRWAITAVDDILGTGLKQKMKQYSSIDSILLFHATLYANQIIILLLPGGWKFEMIELWESNSLWSKDGETIIRDGEGPKPRTSYSPIAGAYYSARLAVSEYLNRLHRCAQILVIRSVSGDYWAPLGTWVIREATRRALEQQPLSCRSLDDAITLIKTITKHSRWLTHSRLIHEIKTQKTLQDY